MIHDNLDKKPNDTKFSERDMQFEKEGQIIQTKEALNICVDMAVRLEQEDFIFRNMAQAILKLENPEIRSELLTHLLNLVASFLSKVYFNS